MNPETTNRLSIDSNQDKPRIIYRGTATVTTSTAGTFVAGGTTISLTQLKASSTCLIEVYMKDNQTNYVYSLPFVTGNSSGQFVLNGSYTLTSELVNGQYTQVLTFSVVKRGGSVSDTYTCYYVVYSTRSSEVEIL